MGRLITDINGDRDMNGDQIHWKENLGNKGNVLAT